MYSLKLHYKFFIIDFKSYCISLYQKISMWYKIIKIVLNNPIQSFICNGIPNSTFLIISNILLWVLNCNFVSLIFSFICCLKAIFDITNTDDNYSRILHNLTFINCVIYIIMGLVIIYKI